MKPKPIVVFDTNIYISAIIFGGNPRHCLELAREGEVALFTGKSILLEISQKLRRKFSWKEADIREVIEGLLLFTKIVSPPKEINLIKKDPSDNRILEVAEEAKADFIVSGDKKHLLSLKKFRGIPILSSKEFLDIFYNKS